ncbi:hypothetical protein [Parerythrobacter lacustris]|uniref:Uncharacterized protein n=1 Tax=Parerythrobacter lacustris TaxID=2969984 RepID=A0ABT1XPN2_9SPHN|nr:hypothetical protein [Parerythrobacter lacustris]MCR2832891.1 hypothetical protein [Parerythrobacter lacustris]
MNCRGFTVALAAIALAAAPHAIAKTPRDSYCSWIKETPEGRFTYEMKLGWSLIREGALEGGPELPEDVVGISCLRDPPVLVAGDVALLERGVEIYFGLGGAGFSTIKYRLTDGVIAYELSGGALSARQKKDVDRALADAQKLVGDQGAAN